MAILEVLQYPDSRLRTKAKPVTEVNDTIRSLVKNMFETMYAEKGIGLAATQVNHHIRLLITNVSEDHSNPRVFINPEIIAQEGVQWCTEGCLSIPGETEKVARSENITVSALDENGERFEYQATGLEAVCIQHEMDHLVGKLFVDYLSPIKRARVEKRMEKQLRQIKRDSEL